jgi:hypothetical protein
VLRRGGSNPLGATKFRKEKEMANNPQRPRYCGTCGSALRTLTSVTGYNVYTGEPEQAESLYCPTTTAVRKGFRGVANVPANHVSWNLDRTSGEWHAL